MPLQIDHDRHLTKVDKSSKICKAFVEKNTKVRQTTITNDKNRRILGVKTRRSSKKVKFSKVEKTISSLELMIRFDENVRTGPLSVRVSPQVPENVKVLGTKKS
jgi:hypothetical protein